VEAQRVFDVSPEGDHWVVLDREAGLRVAMFGTVEEALTQARQAAGALPHATIVLRDREGVIRQEEEVGRETAADARGI
jgi:hypothetical protein